MGDYINQFINWLSSWADVFLEKAFNIIIDIFQFVIDAIPVFILSLVQLFGYACPPPPFSTTPGEGTSNLFAFIINCVNWLFPMSFSVLMIQFIVCAMTAYFACMVVFRWAKALT